MSTKPLTQIMSNAINKAIPADQIIPNPDQQRKNKGFDLESITELGDSIIQHGLQQAIRVVRVEAEQMDYLELRLEQRLAETQQATELGTIGGDKFFLKALENLRAIKNAPKNRQKALYVIVYGERRWRAHIQKGIQEVNCVIDTELTWQGVQTIMLLENSQREAVGFSEEAESYVNWMQANGLDVENPDHRKQLATTINKSITYINWRLDARKLIPTAQEAMKRDELTANHVYYLSRLNDENQAKLFSMIQSGKCASLFQLEAAYKALLQEADTKKLEQQSLDIEVADKSKAIALTNKITRIAEQLCSIAEDDDAEVDEAFAQMSLGEVQRLMQTLELMKRNVAHIYKNQAAYHEQALIASKVKI